MKREIILIAVLFILFLVSVGIVSARISHEIRTQGLKGMLTEIWEGDNGNHN